MSTRVPRLAAGCIAALIIGAACSTHHRADTAARRASNTRPAEPGTTASSEPSLQPVTSSVAGAPTTDPNQAEAPAAPSTGAATKPAAAVVDETVALSASLTGESEIPNPRIPGGHGTTTLSITGMELCYTIDAPIQEKPIIANIYKGAAGEAGAIVINFEIVFERTASGFKAQKCLDKDRALLDGIIANPAGFYVNVFTNEHPRGALRGQLKAS